MENEILWVRLKADEEKTKLVDTRLFLNGSCQAGKFPTDSIFPVTPRTKSATD